MTGSHQFHFVKFSHSFVYNCTRQLSQGRSNIRTSAHKNVATSRSSNSCRYLKNRLFVGASEIANLINLNPHVLVGEAVEWLWEKNNRKTLMEALARNKLQSFIREERLKEIRVLELATAVVETEDPKEYRRRLGKALNGAHSAQDKRVIRDFINTSRGIKDEKRTFQSLKQKDLSAQLDLDVNLYQRIINIPNTEVEYLISGYVDGIDLRNGHIVEIKNRQNRLFNHVPLYEQVQCQAYLFLTGRTVCEHTESFRGVLQSTTLQFEPVFWKHILDRLNNVVLAASHLMEDVNAQDDFFRTGDLFETIQGKNPKGHIHGYRSRQLETELTVCENELGRTNEEI